VEDVELIRRRLGVFDREEDHDPALHTGMLVYGNEPRGRWNAIHAMAAPDRILRSVRRISDKPAAP
jgi:hypothetical protein